MPFKLTSTDLEHDPLDEQSQAHFRKREDESFQTWGCILPLIFCGCIGFLVTIIFNDPGTGGLLFFILLLPSAIGFIFLEPQISGTRSSSSDKRFAQAQTSYQNQKKREKATFDSQFAYLCNKYSFIFE